jgi:hypothetical protein
MEPDPKTAARIAALQKEMDAIHHANSVLVQPEMEK